MSAEMVFSEKMSLLGENQAEPKIKVTIARIVAITARRTTVPSIAVPAATTEHTEEPTKSTSRISLR